MAIKIKILVMIKFILGFVLNGFEFQKKKPRIDLRNHLNDWFWSLQTLVRLLRKVLGHLSCKYPKCLKEYTASYGVQCESHYKSPN